jgi:tetratricopeptide (TPR) repeat protein
MGFQGDVAGLGLGELLQGLARGGREGVLTLHGRGLSGTLGISNGQLHLLPEPDEDSELWRKRCERAWIKDPNHRIDALRMSEIAYAARLERLFELLDCEGLHFRFEPGSLPTSSPLSTEPETDVFDLDRPQKIESRQPVHCPPVSVEFVLLEHARMADESYSHSDSLAISPHDVPRLLDPGSIGQLTERFFAECDGLSSMTEIADRLAWPIRQCRAVLQEQIGLALLRLSDARELLVLSQRELSQNRFARAASRLAGWCLHSQPGPAGAGDLDLLLNEWKSGKLQVAITSMTAREARTLLRRIDHGAHDPKLALARWRELRKHHRHDLISEISTLHWQLACDEDAPAMADLLKLARNFQDRGLHLRATIMLRSAARRAPETVSMRLELGQRMLSAGMTEEGAPWVLEACAALIESNLIEKALPPLRQLLSADPRNREAKKLLGQARGKSVQGRARRRNFAVGLAVLLILSLVAVVQVRSQAARQKRLEDVLESSNRPEVALALLEQNFAGDDSPRVQALRESLREQLRKTDGDLRETWLAQYRECQLECTLGDPLLGLSRTLELPDPPELHAPGAAAEMWPAISDVLDALAAGIEQDVAEQTTSGTEPTPEELHAEERLSRTIEDLLTRAATSPRTETVSPFKQRMRAVQETLRQRNELRATERRERLKKELLAQQDLLLAAARAHAQAGDLDRAVDAFHRLVEMEGSQTLKTVLAREIAGVEAHRQAVLEARQLAAEGRHDEALRTLSRICKRPGEHLLPWRLDSQPSNARAHFADGSTRVTPCTLETSPGEHLEFSLELAGHETSTVAVDDPGDRTVLLSRRPSRWWRTRARVEAPPVSVEDDHIVCDRAGSVARLTLGEPRWSHELESLGGIARAPVFMPRRPGFLLMVTEVGQIWLAEVATGKLEGPYNLNSPPIEGPIATGRTVTARFADGRRAEWDTKLKPETLGAPTLDAPVSAHSSPETTPSGATAGLEMLRHRAGSGDTLASPWTRWSVRIEATTFTVTQGETQASFHASRTGDWVYVAWEAPNSKIPQGRLWISDGAGLRAFEP